MSAWIVVVIGLACGGAGFMAGIKRERWLAEDVNSSLRRIEFWVSRASALPCGIKREIRMLREMLDFRYSPW
jgi:hypothetical protein